jgi:hypothetical protein
MNNGAKGHPVGPVHNANGFLLDFIDGYFLYAQLFYLVTDGYSQGNMKEMRKWAYEIHSTFLLDRAVCAAIFLLFFPSIALFSFPAKTNVEAGHKRAVSPPSVAART